MVEDLKNGKLDNDIFLINATIDLSLLRDLLVMDETTEVFEKSIYSILINHLRFIEQLNNYLVSKKPIKTQNLKLFTKYLFACNGIILISEKYLKYVNKEFDKDDLTEWVNVHIQETQKELKISYFTIAK